MLKNKSEVTWRHLDGVRLRRAISSSDDASLLINCIYSPISFKLQSLEGTGITSQSLVVLAHLLLERFRSCRSAVWVRNPGLGRISDVGKLVQIIPVTRHIFVCKRGWRLKIDTILKKRS
jgi:hypothetical protein